VIYSYRVYGLNCRANVPIPGLRREEFPSEEPDICLHISSAPPEWVYEAWTLSASEIHRKPAADGLLGSQPCVTVFGNNAYFQLAYGDGTQFVMDGAGKSLWGTCSAPLSAEDLAVYLRGPALGFALRLRGITSLHASAVVIRSMAVLFCGSSESGKSTTAAALSLQGRAVLCDDIAPLSRHNAVYQVEPGYSRICLWPDVVRILLGTPNALPRLTPTWEKCFLPLDGAIANYEEQRRPLAIIYVLADRDNADAPRIDEIAPREALVELVKNTYMNWFSDRKQRAAEFHDLSEIVTRVPVRRIVPHLQSSRIHDLCGLITSDAEDVITNRRPAGILAAR